MTRHGLITVLTSICAVAGVGLVVGGCARVPNGSNQSPGELAIDEDTVTYRGAHLKLGTSFDEWKRALGEPSRYVDRSGGIYVWDNLGLAASLRFEFSRSDPHVAALHIFFAPREVDFWPHTVFKGAVDFVQRNGEPGGASVVAKLDAATTAFELEHREHVSTRYGYPNLSRYTLARFAGRGVGVPDGPLELCSVRVDPSTRLPSDRTAGDGSPP